MMTIEVRAQKQWLRRSKSLNLIKVLSIHSRRDEGPDEEATWLWVRSEPPNPASSAVAPP